MTFIWLCCGVPCCAAETADAAPPDASHEPENTTAGNLRPFGLPLRGLGSTGPMSEDGAAPSSRPGDATEFEQALGWNRLNGSPRNGVALAFGRMERVTCGLRSAPRPRDAWAGALVGIPGNHDLSDLKLPWGELSIGVSMIAPPAANDGFAAFGGAGLDLHEWMPGLHMRLSF